MKMPQVSLLEWQKQYGTEKACAAAIAKYRWPNGFMCPKCGDYKATAMSNVPQEQWKEFVPADELDDLLLKHAAAMKSH